MEKLGTQQDVLIRTDVFRFIKSCHQTFDFIFADPPYALPELKEIPKLVLQHGLLKENGVFVFEHGKKDEFTNLPEFVEHRHYGSVNFSIFQCVQNVEGKENNHEIQP